MSKHVYGYCPICGAPGALRERRADGNDTCTGGHIYPSRTARIPITLDLGRKLMSSLATLCGSCKKDRATCGAQSRLTAHDGDNEAVIWCDRYESTGSV